MNKVTKKNSIWTMLDSSFIDVHMVDCYYDYVITDEDEIMMVGTQKLISETGRLIIEKNGEYWLDNLRLYFFTSTPVV